MLRGTLLDFNGRALHRNPGKLVQGGEQHHCSGKTRDETAGLHLQSV